MRAGTDRSSSTSLPYLIAADPSLAGVLQNWLDGHGRRPCLVVSGSSRHMMQGAVLGADAPLYGRAVEAFAVRPLRPGYLADVFTAEPPRALVCAYALWGGMPRYWELAEPYGGDLAAAVDELVLDPSGPLHEEPDRLLRAETPPATALRPLLDAIGAGAHRISEIAGRLGKPASSLSRQVAALIEMDFVRREIPFGSSPASGKRSLYRIDDPFLRLWFAAVAPHRAALAEAPRDTRLHYWRRHQAALEAYAWEELCRMAVPELHRSDTPLGRLGPWEPAQRYGAATPPISTSSRARSTAGGCWWARRSGPLDPVPYRGPVRCPASAPCPARRAWRSSAPGSYPRRRSRPMPRPPCTWWMHAT